MSQLALEVGSQADDLIDNAQTAIRRKTREGLHLAWAVDQVQNAGVITPVIPVLRHGLVLDQVVAELRDGKYDLLVIGSHHVSGRSRTLNAFLEYVASDLVSETSCSVLII
jgi:nucleotide-binding universal stress UspA family protein